LFRVRRHRDVCDALRMRDCRWCCRPFCICKCEDRGHAYCCEECRAGGYVRTRRQARARHATSEEGRLDGRDRQRELRKRRRARVTDQGIGDEGERASLGVAAAAAVVVAAAEPAALEAGDDRSRRIRELAEEVACVVCGRRSRWVVWWPVPRYEWRRVDVRRRPRDRGGGAP